MRKLGAILLTVVLAVALALPMAAVVGAADTLVLVSQPGSSGDYTQTAGYTNTDPEFIDPLDPTNYSGGGIWSDAVAVSSPPSVWASISGATWVSSAATTPSGNGDAWFLFREEFDIPTGATILSASLEFTADDAVEVYLNDVLVKSTGDVYGTAPSPQPDPTYWSITFTPDAPGDFAPTAGTNTLSFVVRNWSYTAYNPTGLLYKAVIAYTEDPSEVPGTVFAYIPNSGEASVSKVDVVANTEVAWYSTIPHRSTPDYTPIEFYRPVRLVIDSGGNAWALNTMSVGTYYPTYPNAQGSVARISSTPVGGDNTSTSGGLGGIVENDDRVTFFDVGDPGDFPRSISIVEEGGEIYLWIGFYVGNYFQKYHYDTSGTPALVEVSGQNVDVDDYTPYYTVIDDGYMWVSSRNSGWPVPGVNGVLLVDLSGLTYTALTYDPPGDTTDIPYALLIDSDGRCWVSDSGEPSPRDRYFAVYTRTDGTVTGPEYIEVGSYPVMCGFIEFDGDIWATAYDGQVLKGTENGSWTFTEVFNPIATGATWLTGVGQDPFGYLWVVSHDMDKLYKFDPAAPGTPIEVPVGDGPYAYALSVVPPTTRIEVEKDYRYTNVCFERDNDGDGLYNEDDIDCPLGSYLGGELPMANGNYILEAVIHPKNNKVRSYNPGQYYAVSTVTVLDDVETLTIFEDWDDCDEISTLNPRNGGGCVVIVQVGGEINGVPVPDPSAAYQILDATSDAVTISGNTATAVLEDVKAGTTIYMYVKFGPGLKGVVWEGPYRPCENINAASVVEEPTVPEDWIEATANLIVVAKD